ncbi:MAG: exodeoxyribonuclease VII large subunit [Alphaproteobacteria bacterium]|nr:exodeoxyribonuclease VII large subunit [Alphaproteobacteria bacterium]
MTELNISKEMVAQNMRCLTQDSAEFTVDEITQRIKQFVEGEFSCLRIRGEISGYRGPHSSGHCYFALKDKNAKLDAIIWRGIFSKLRFKPEEGVEVVATGRLTTYPARSSYQIVIDALEPAGEGALMAMLEERKRVLRAAGFFSEERKQRLPFLPRIIGVITSPTGAVIQDILNRLEERFPCHVLIWPVRVQGECCGEEVAEAIYGLNHLPPSVSETPDVIIVARGGGSIEELWGFNEEIVVRAVADSFIPVISAVGHETDWTLIDLVSDCRVSTPTAAAEIATPVRVELLSKLEVLSGRCGLSVSRCMDFHRLKASAVMYARISAADILALPRQRLDLVHSELVDGLQSVVRAHISRFHHVAPRLISLILCQRIVQDRQKVVNISQRMSYAVKSFGVMRKQALSVTGKFLESLGYQSILKRGYTLLYDSKGILVRSVTSVATGDVLKIRLDDGFVAVIAESSFFSGPEQLSGEKKKLSPEEKGTVSSPDPFHEQGRLL